MNNPGSITLLTIAALAGEPVMAEPGGSTGERVQAPAVCSAIRSDDLVSFREALARSWDHQRRRSKQAMTDQELVTRLDCDGSNLLEYAKAHKAVSVMEFMVAGSLDPQLVEAVLREDEPQLSATP